MPANEVYAEGECHLCTNESQGRRRSLSVGTYMAAFIEVDHGDGQPPFSDPVTIHSLVDGPFNLDRAYDVFDALAGGRHSHMAPVDRNARRLPLIPPRGMPEPCSASVAQYYFYLVCESADRPNRHVWPEWRCIAPAEAAGWVRDRRSHEANFRSWFNGNRTWRVVSQPENYGASWLSFADVEASLRHHELTWDSIPVCYRIIRSAMAQLVEEHGASRVRLVVWFS